MTGSPSISVVIVNWNGARHLGRCLEALAAQTYRDFEVIVVDNGSTDGSPDLVAERFPAARLLRQDANLGFAAGNNVGAAAARGEWLALLNNDAFAAPDWLDQLAAATRAHPDFGGFASCQLQADAPDRLDGAGDAYHSVGISWRMGLGHPAGAPWDAPREIFAPCACAALYRREVFEALGGFDEAFFCYFEDVDLAFRMQLAGQRFLYWPHAVVHHVGSGSAGRVSDFARYHGHRNLVWTFLKNMPGTLLWRYLPGHVLFNLATLLRFAQRGEAGPVWRAKRDALAALPRVWAERRRVQAGLKVAPSAIARRMVHGLAPLWLAAKERP